MPNLTRRSIHEHLLLNPFRRCRNRLPVRPAAVQLSFEQFSSRAWPIEHLRQEMRLGIPVLPDWLVGLLCFVGGSFSEGGPMSRQVHRNLYRKIPEFQCKPGCSDCCGPVPVSEYEAKRLGITGFMTPTKPGTLTCAFVGEDGCCTVYEKRPFLCRLFGSAENNKLRCPHGFGPDKKLSCDQADRLTVEFHRVMDV